MKLVTPDELYQAPELATLALLEQTLQQTIYALCAAHPEMADEVPFHLREYIPLEIWTADAICSQAHAVKHAIARYREAIERANRLDISQKRG